MNKRFPVDIMSFFIAALIATVATLVVSRVIVTEAEGLIRSSATVLGLIAVPLLMLLAIRNRRRAGPSRLTILRRGVGSASIVLVAGVWVIATILFFWPNSSGFFNLEWSAILGYSSFLAVLLATALASPSKYQVMTAGLLLWAWLHAGIYI